MNEEDLRQQDHRRMSRSGIIACPMNPGPWGFVGVVDFFVLPGFAQTPTGPRSGWPADGWGSSVDVPEVFSMSSCARTPTLLSDGKGPLRRRTKAKRKDR